MRPPPFRRFGGQDRPDQSLSPFHIHAPFPILSPFSHLITEVLQFEYLGLILDPKLTMDLATTETIRRAVHGQSLTQVVSYSLRYDQKRSQLTPTQPFTRALRRFDLSSWSSHTPLQQTAILLGSRPPKLLQKHDKAWTDSTSPTYTQLIYSLQSHFSKHLSSRSTAPVPSLISSLGRLPSDDTQYQVFKVLLTRKEYSSATYVTPVGTWATSSPPSPPSLLGYGNVPCVPPLSPHPRSHYDTSASPSPS